MRTQRFGSRVRLGSGEAAGDEMRERSLSIQQVHQRIEWAQTHSASEVFQRDVRVAQERPDLVGEIQSSVIEIAGALQSRFGPATEKYFTAKRVVTARHQLGELTEKLVLLYARVHKIEEATVGLSLLSPLPVSAVERALADPEMTLILAKANKFEWETTMALLFLAAKDGRIKASDLDGMRDEFARLNTKTCQEVLSFYQSRKHAASAQFDQRRLPQLHTI